ncbi:MAG: amidohydrolase family protein, partial [Actinobacteria bacterium]|nr:amidohydrolase family protein [Actinomycetota bacterium]
VGMENKAQGLTHPVLDIHVHALTPGVWTPGMLAFVEKANPEEDAAADLHADPAHLRRILSGLGVDHAVVLAEEAPVTSGMITSEWVQDYCSGAPGLHPFVSLNPCLGGDPVERLDLLLERGPVAGIKLLPPYQYWFANDRAMYPVYARAEELRLPCTFHTGTSRIPGTRLKYADPMYLDDVAVDFPELPILMAHSGRGVWYGHAAMLATFHPNVYLEISGLPPRNLPRYFPELDRLVAKMV